MPHPIPRKVYIVSKNKNCEIANQSLAYVAKIIGICIEDFCMMDIKTIKQVIENSIDIKDCNISRM
jgi:hypothetical protein